MKETFSQADIETMKQNIDALSQEDMARLWRFAPAGHPYFRHDLPEVSNYFQARFKGFTPEVSKKIGWDKK